MKKRNVISVLLTFLVILIPVRVFGADPVDLNAYTITSVPDFSFTGKYYFDENGVLQLDYSKETGIVSGQNTLGVDVDLALGLGLGVATATENITATSNLPEGISIDFEGSNGNGQIKQGSNIVATMTGQLAVLSNPYYTNTITHATLNYGDDASIIQQLTANGTVNYTITYSVTTPPVGS